LSPELECQPRRTIASRLQDGFLGLLGCAVWLVTSHYDALADGRVQIAVGIVVLIALGIAAALFVRQGKSGFVIDKRNVWDTTRFQWRKRIAEDRDRSDRG
jgi:hypothetical protein